MFKVPTKREIVARTVFRAAGRNIALTDLTTISTWRILLEECIVEELLALHEGLAREHDQWFINSATGANLDRRLADFGVSRPGPFPASGTVKITAISPGPTVTLPAGAVVRTAPTDGSDPKRFALRANPDTAGGEWSGLAVDDTLAVVALQSGVEGNVPAGAITVVDGYDVTVTNVAPFSNGRAVASDAEARDYFRDVLRALPRCTRAAIQVAILNYLDPVTLDYPVASVSFEEWNGLVLLSGSAQALAARIYICDGSGVADANLVAAIQTYLDGTDGEGSGYRAAGCPMEVVSATPLPIAVACSVQVDSAYNAPTAGQQVEQAIRTYLASIPIAGVTMGGVLKGQFNFSRLFRSVMDVPGVLRVSFESPVGDRPIPVGSKAVAGTIRVTAVSVSS